MVVLKGEMSRDLYTLVGRSYRGNYYE